MSKNRFEIEDGHLRVKVNGERSSKKMTDRIGQMDERLQVKHIACHRAERRVIAETLRYVKIHTVG